MLEYFEYFCQMSSKSILIILSHTVPKLVRFETQCIVSHQEMSPKHLIYTVSQKTTQL